MPIRTLPTLLINQIAAGEVIERPASVVKELTENALDAGATHINLTIEEGGAQLIRISDDGIGIPPEELTLAVSPHATSKITASDELEAIATLGFRGEALASIASISRLRITSRPTTENGIAEAAAVLEVEGDSITGPTPASGKPGTVIEVRDLFFNTPARRKFMRSPASEFGHINDTLARIAIVNPDCGFTLTHNARTVRDLPRNQSRKERCIDLLGKDLEEALLEFDHHDDPTRGSAHCWGLAGLPSLARATSKFQHLCINGRPIKDRNLMHAIKEAYRGLMPPDKFPMVVLFIDLDPALVDVNVHPQKAEVRFRNPSHVHGLVLTALRQRLLSADLTPKLGVGSWGAGAGAKSSDARSDAILSTADTLAPTPITQYPSPSTFVDYFRAMDPKQKGFVYNEVKQQLKRDLAEEDVEEDEAFEAQLRSSQAAAGPPTEIRNPKSEIFNILQIHDSYVVTQDEQGLVIIDQHALHERVMFEQLRKRILEDKAALESQRLLMPEVVRADDARQARLEELRPLLDRLGIEADPIGPDQIAIHAFPSLLFSRSVKIGDFMQELLDKAEAGAFDQLELGAADGVGSDPQLPEEAALHEVLDMMSCKAAIKAGDKMSEQELAALLAKRDEIERSSNCPHGRPTTLRLTLKDLERQFGRS
ncbi:MAG: DNA mismatch repair endonuclease MutL [Phycisphaeraceae bacterium]